MRITSYFLQASAFYEDTQKLVMLCVQVAEIFDHWRFLGYVKSFMENKAIEKFALERKIKWVGETFKKFKRRYRMLTWNKKCLLLVVKSLLYIKNIWFWILRFLALDV